MIQSQCGKKDISSKYADLVELLRNNSPDRAKKLVTENNELMTYEADGRLAVSPLTAEALDCYFSVTLGLCRWLFAFCSVGCLKG